MSVQTNPRLLQIAEYFDLRIQYSYRLPDKVVGSIRFDSDPAFIVLNAQQTLADLNFTLAHEMAHYVMHQNGNRRFDLPRFLTRSWKSKSVAKIMRSVRLKLVKNFGREWEADMWAFVCLIRLEDKETLRDIIEKYPEKTGTFCLSSLAVILGGLRMRGRNLLSGISGPPTE